MPNRRKSRIRCCQNAENNMQKRKKGTQIRKTQVINHPVCLTNDDDKKSTIRMSLINTLNSDIRSTPTRGLLILPPIFLIIKYKKDFFSFSVVNNYMIPVNNIAPNTNKFSLNTNKFSTKNAVTIYDAILFPLCEQILPLQYRGKSISHSQSLKLLSKTDSV